ncbi:hypothetical protein AB0K60_18010 [Thermopolyspora sp. NPDC052614]|uniref:hypothetical protein n=1 Tax=Thermopolyspora sp. NPDC052614 TaxID=3155682 RepID=UPI00344A5538
MRRSLASAAGYRPCRAPAPSKASMTTDWGIAPVISGSFSVRAAGAGVGAAFAAGRQVQKP